MSRIEGRLAKTLLDKKTVVTRAVFWKIPHDSGKEDIRLKLGRYKKNDDFDLDEEPETLIPKSELTLEQEEFQALFGFLRESYEPFRQGIAVRRTRSMNRGVSVELRYRLGDNVVALRRARGWLQRELAAH